MSDEPEKDKRPTVQWPPLPPGPSSGHLPAVERLLLLLTDHELNWLKVYGIHHAQRGRLAAATVVDVWPPPGSNGHG